MEGGVYCCNCLEDVCKTRSLAAGRCRHVFCGKCVSALEDCEVVTCPYDLSAMLVGQIRPNLQLMRKAFQLDQLKEENNQEGIRQCWEEMRACVNIQGVPCKLAVVDECSSDSCLYTHSPTLIRRARDVAQEMAALESGVDRYPVSKSSPQPVTRPCWLVRGAQFLLESVILAFLLVAVQVMLCGLVACWVLIEALLKVINAGKGGVLRGILKFPLLVWSWTALHCVLVLRSLTLKLSRALNSPPPRLPPRLRSLLTPVLSTHLT